MKALTTAAKALRAGTGKRLSPPVLRFASALDDLAKATPQTREKARLAVFGGFDKLLAQLRDALQAAARHARLFA